MISEMAFCFFCSFSHPFGDLLVFAPQEKLCINLKKLIGIFGGESDRFWLVGKRELEKLNAVLLMLSTYKSFGDFFDIGRLSVTADTISVVEGRKTASTDASADPPIFRVPTADLIEPAAMCHSVDRS
jgi:hypothetical protein